MGSGGIPSQYQAGRFVLLFLRKEALACLMLVACLSSLEVAYEQHGSTTADAVVLLHGFPYSPRAYDEVAPALGAAGYRVIVPFLRGYGPTRLHPGIMRSGQQAALAHDLLGLPDALEIPRAAVAGYDWGGRAACILAALWPDRVRCLVTGNGYNIQDIAAAASPLAAEAEYRLWYQYYFHGERGRAGLTENRYELGRFLWRLWSPDWAFTEAVYAQTATAFENPDFVEVVLHSYRHRFGYVTGDALYAETEAALAAQPTIGVPTVALWGAGDGVGPPSADDTHRDKFVGAYERRVLPGVGHNVPQEAPDAFLAALLTVLG
jgi:pimeloyl-ACP methyl ester carboxylesterase